MIQSHILLMKIYYKVIYFMENFKPSFRSIDKTLGRA